MEKIKLTREMLYDGQFEEILGERKGEVIDLKGAEKSAMEAIDKAVVFDPMGIVYEDYAAPVRLTLAMLENIYGLDCSEAPEGEIYQIFLRVMEDTGAAANFALTADLYKRMLEIVKARYTAEHSLSYKLSVLVDAMMEQKDADTQEMGERLIALMEKAKGADEKPSTPELKLFAKKG